MKLALQPSSEPTKNIAITLAIWKPEKAKKKGSKKLKFFQKIFCDLKVRISFAVLLKTT